MRAHEHAVAAGLVGGLHHELVEILDHVLFVGFLAGEVGRHVRQDRVLVEVVLDDARDEIIHDLVVGHAGADRVGERDVAGAVGVDEAGHAEGGVLAEDGRVEEVVVDAAVDHMHGLQALGRAHEHVLVLHEQVAALDDLDAHLAREVGVLEVGGVVGAGREDHHGGIGHARGRGVLEDLEELVGVVFHGAHAASLEDFREGALQRAAVLEHVADAGRAARVILEYKILTLVVADDVGAADVDVDVARHLDVHELPAEMLRRHHVMGGDGAVLDDVLFVIDVVEEEVERRDALDQAGFEVLPFTGGDDAWHEVERENALRALRVAIDVERHALAQEGQVDRGALRLEVLRAHFAKMLDEMLVVRADLPAGLHHLVVKLIRGVIFEGSGRHRGARG